MKFKSQEEFIRYLDEHINDPFIDPWSQDPDAPYGYIYKTTNLINGKLYIGKKENHRGEFNYYYLGSGKYLNKAINKYGRENFDSELIAWYENKEELNKAERYWIKFYNSIRPKGYNISEGGDWGDITKGMTKEEYDAWCKVNSEKNRGKNNGFYGKHHTEESKRKIGARYYPKGEDNPLYGRKLSDETKRKLSESMKGRKAWNKGISTGPMSEETKSKISNSLKGSNNHCYGKISITNGVNNKFINPSDLNYYVELGWRKGSTQRHNKK